LYLATEVHAQVGSVDERDAVLLGVNEGIVNRLPAETTVGVWLGVRIAEYVKAAFDP